VIKGAQDRVAAAGDTRVPPDHRHRVVVVAQRAAEIAERRAVFDANSSY
jgi:hypothetical protein